MWLRACDYRQTAATLLFTCHQIREGANVYQQRVRDIYKQLSPGYRRIADYLLDNYRDAAFMTAAEVGRAAQVDTTSVVRFAQRLGYPGYPELIAEVQQEVKRDLQHIYEPAGDMKRPASVFQRAIIEDRHNLEQVLAHNDSAEIEAVVKLLLAAPRILLVGDSAASFLAEMFALRLAALGLNAWALNGDMMSRMAMSVHMGPQDVILGISPTAISTGVAVVLKVARQEGQQTIAIVGSPVYRAAQVAEHMLYAPSRTAGLFYSPSSVTAVLHALIQAVSAQLSQQSATWAVHADHLMRSYVAAMREEPAMSFREVMRDYAVAQPEARPEDAAADTEAGQD
jgi:DNA-binding MurR/RpiR family transcriptional regulator